MERIDPILARLQDLWTQALRIWQDGGWAMWGIAAIALVLFSMGMHVLLRLRGKGFLSVKERVWRGWIDRPDERRGPVGELLDAVADGQSLEQTGQLFESVKKSELLPFERDLMVMRICVSAAPLVGLLGTVTGMLSTFRALSTGSGGDQTMAMVAEGISEALITTETGLVIALPGPFSPYHLARHPERYRAFLAHLETVCTQGVYWRTRAGKRGSSAPRPALGRATSGPRPQPST